MKTLPAAEGAYVNGFVTSLCLGDRSAASEYRNATANLLQFARARSGRMDLSEEALIAWLKARRTHCAMGRVEQLAQMANRFLDWMKAKGRISSNPFQELISQYGKRLAPIVRAMVSDNPKAALDELRPLPRFGSVLGPLMCQHITLMRSLGYKYDTHEMRLLRFDRFLQCRPDLTDKPLPQMIAAWRQAHPGIQQALHAQLCGRILSKAQARLNPSTVVMRSDPRLLRQAREAYRRPYIYTEEEVVKLLDTARSLPSKLRASSSYTMLVLAYCAGLRIQEVTNLNLGDVNMREGTIEIRNTKFFKNRRLPLTQSVLDALRDYLQERRKAGAPSTPEAGLFWHAQGKRYTKGGVYRLLTDILRRAGIKPARGKIGPRVHDLRHAMACNRLLSWYKEGINPQSRLAHLSTFMGHKNITSTLIYLNITSETLQLASERFRKYVARIFESAKISL